MKLSQLYEDQHPDPAKMTPEEAFRYAHDVIKDRWPEGEEIIKKDPECAYFYALNVIQDRWPEGEEIIKKDPYWAYYYARFVIKDRWPEGEEAIKKDPYWWKKYQKDVLLPWQKKQEWIKRGEEFQKRTGKLPDEDVFGP